MSSNRVQRSRRESIHVHFLQGSRKRRALEDGPWVFTFLLEKKKIGEEFRVKGVEIIASMEE